MTEATEFEDIYNLRVVDIPTNKEVERIDHQDQIYKSFDDKFEAIVGLIKECAEREGYRYLQIPSLRSWLFLSSQTISGTGGNSSGR